MSKPIFPEGDNSKDPLKKTGPDPQLELLRQFGTAARGFPNDLVIGAAINLLINSLRQTYPNRAAAEARYSELVGQFRAVLLNHYDSVTGRRKSIFPFHQVIAVDLFKDRDRFN